MYTDFGYIGKTDGIEYATVEEALEANPNNQQRGTEKSLCSKYLQKDCNIFIKCSQPHYKKECDVHDSNKNLQGQQLDMIASKTKIKPKDHATG